MPGVVRRERTPALVAALAVPALLTVALFREHAFDHDFWWYFAIPVAVLAGAKTDRTLSERVHPLAGATFVLLCASWGAVSIVQQHGAWATTQYRDFGAAVNRLADAGDLVMSPEMIAQEHFYIAAYTKEGVRTPRALDAVIERWRGGEVTAEQIYFLLPAEVAPRYPELAAHLARVATRVDGFQGAVWQLR